MKKNIMKSIILLTVLTLISLFNLNSVHASGDKVRGDLSTGPSYQNGVCPFTG